MSTPVTSGRGRGYSGRNKDIRRPGNPPVTETVPSPIGKNASTPVAASSQPSQRSTPYKPPNNKSQVSSQPQNSFQATPSQEMMQGSGKMSQVTPSAKSQNPQGYSGHSVHVVNASSNQDRGVQDTRNFSETVADENSQSVLFIEEKFSNLIKQISCLSSQDDGILTNQKLQHIDGVLAKSCPQPALLRGAMEAVASAAMMEAVMTARVSIMACSVWFSRTKLLGQRLHKLFIDALTDKIDGLEVSLEGADQHLVNAISLLTDIYAGTKLLSNDELTNLAQLVVQVLIELLDCNTPLALRTLNVQLMQHGQKLYLSVPEKLELVSLSARKLIISRQPLPPPCRIWLSLLADQCLYRFEPLPKYLQDFYARHLDESTPDESRDKRYASKPKSSEENQPDPYQSRQKQPVPVNLREPRRSLKSDSSDRWSLNSNGDPSKPGIVPDDYTKYKDDVFDGLPNDSFDSSGVSDSNISDGGNNDYISVNGGSHGERKPRPILGAGRMTQSATVNRSEFESNQFDFSEPPPPIQNMSEFEESVEIPKFCASKPPPNFIPRNQQKITSASQESTDYWKTTPPPANKRMDNVQVNQVALSLAQRLDLNTWRQQQANGANEDQNLEEFNLRQLQNQSMQQNLEQPEVQKTNMLSHFNTDNNPDLEWKPSTDKQVKEEGSGRWGKGYNENKEESNWDQFNQLHLDTGVSHWGKKRDSFDGSSAQKDLDKGTEKEKNWSRGQPQRERRPNEGGSWQDRRENNRDKKDGEEVDSNWRRRDSGDTKEWEGKKQQGNWSNRKSGEIKTTEWTNRNLPSEVSEKPGRISKEGSLTKDENREEDLDDPKSMIRRDSRGTRVKRDPMESSRKASYWTHDDRCDRDYDG